MSREIPPGESPLARDVEVANAPQQDQQTRKEYDDAFAVGRPRADRFQRVTPAPQTPRCPATPGTRSTLAETASEAENPPHDTVRVVAAIGIAVAIGL